MALKHGFVEAELFHPLLQPAVLVGELLQFVDLLRLKPAILLLPAMEGLLRNPHLPDQVGHSQPHLRLLQNRNNLPSRKTLLLHSRSPLFQGEIRQKTNIKSGPFCQCHLKAIKVGSAVHFASAVYRATGAGVSLRHLIPMCSSEPQEHV